VAYTLQVGRRAFSHRRVVVAAGLDEAAAALRSAEARLASVCERSNPPVVLLLAREQDVPVGAWRDLYEEDGVFRQAMTRCAEEAGPAGSRMLEALYPTRVRVASPAVVEADLQPLAAFAVEHALARLWESWGVRFEAVVGEGVGALVTASLNASMDLASAVRLAGHGPTREELRPVLSPDGDRLHLEVGTNGVALRAAAPSSRVPSTTRGRLLEVVGRLWLAGVDIDWPAVHAPERRRRLALPTYPFERERFWVEPLPEKPPDVAARLYRPVWKPALPTAAAHAERGRSLVFLDSTGLGGKLVERLRAAGEDVVTVRIGSAFGGDPATGYRIDPGRIGDYASLWEDLRTRGKLPETVIHLWSSEPLDPVLPVRERFRRASELGFYSLLHLAATRPQGPLRLQVVSTGLHEVIGGELLAPEKAPLLALCRVLAQEEHGLVCTSIDVELPFNGAGAPAEQLLLELERPRPEPVVACRRGRQWVPDYDAIPAEIPEAEGSPEPAPRPARIQEGGVYLITGGLGNVGFVLALSLARHGRPKLVLTGRTGLPARETWGDWLKSHDDTEATAIRIRKVQALESLGSEVMVLAADAADAVQMKAVVQETRERFGALHGVIHAAGELSADTFRLVRDLTPEVCERQFAPKVHGLLALHEALEGSPLDFCVLTSSLSSVLGGVG
ncbi:MAG TPA: SDR family oxidoreductase, partial [Vicinamibacteria bacterium]